MVKAQKDPMEPPRLKTIQKISRGPPSPTAPVLYSPIYSQGNSSKCLLIQCMQVNIKICELKGGNIGIVEKAQETRFGLVSHRHV